MNQAGYHVPNLDANGTTREQLQALVDGYRRGEGFPEDYPAGDVRNAYRASLAAHAVLAYDERCNSGSDEPLETVIKDLMSDLMHLCDLVTDIDRYDWDFDNFALQARRHYEEEVAGE